MRGANCRRSGRARGFVDECAAENANYADNLPADMQPVTQSEMHFSVSRPILAYIQKATQKTLR